MVVKEVSRVAQNPSFEGTLVVQWQPVIVISFKGGAIDCYFISTTVYMETTRYFKKTEEKPKIELANEMMLL